MQVQSKQNLHNYFIGFQMSATLADGKGVKRHEKVHGKVRFWVVFEGLWITIILLLPQPPHHLQTILIRFGLAADEFIEAKHLDILALPQPLFPIHAIHLDLPSDVFLERLTGDFLNKTLREQTCRVRVEML